MYGPSQESSTLPWAKFQIFLERFLYLINDIDENLNKNFNL